MKYKYKKVEVLGRGVGGNPDVGGWDVLLETLNEEGDKGLRTVAVLHGVGTLVAIIEREVPELPAQLNASEQRINLSSDPEGDLSALLSDPEINSDLVKLENPDQDGTAPHERSKTN